MEKMVLTLIRLETTSPIPCLMQTRTMIAENIICKADAVCKNLLPGSNFLRLKCMYLRQDHLHQQNLPVHQEPPLY